MKLYYSPGSCALGIHLLLEEIGAPYETHAVKFAEKEQYSPAFTAINPKNKVPALLRDDGSVLTEFPAIAYWLARSNPAAGLLPDAIEAQTHAFEYLDYCVATLHMQGFARIFRPENFSTDPSGEAASKARGKEMVGKGFAIMDQALAGKEYLVGSFSIADAALFYVEFWAAARVKLELPPNCAAHYQRMLARPAVQRMVEQEGLPV